MSDPVSAFPNSGPCCTEPWTTDIFTGESIPTSRDYCECWGGTWELDIPFTYDTLISSMITTFMISTNSAWTDIMNAAVWSSGIDMEPYRNSNLQYVYFFVLNVLVTSFIGVGMFVGVLYDKFVEMRGVQDGSFMLTPQQKQWRKTQVLQWSMNNIYNCSCDYS